MPFEIGIAHYDDPPPEVIGRPRGAARGRPLPLRQPAARPGSRSRTGRSSGHGHGGQGLIGSTTLRLGQARGHVRGRSRCPTCGPSPRSATAGSASCRPPAGAPACPPRGAVRPPPFVQFGAPLAWTTLALTMHADGSVRARAGRRQPVPPPLGLRRRRQARGQVRPHRLQARGTAAPSASTRRGATRTRRRWSPRSRPRSSASCRRRSCAAGRSPTVRKIKAGNDARPSRATRATSCSCCSTASSPSTSTASRWPSSGRARCSASGPCSRAACARPRCGR